MANNVVVIGDTSQSLNTDDISILRHTWVLFTHINRMDPIVRNNAITRNNANMEALLNNVYVPLNRIIRVLTANVVNKDDLSQLGINIQILINELTQMGRPTENYGLYDDLLLTCNRVKQLLTQLGFIYDGVSGIDVPLFNGPTGPSDGPAPPAGVARVGVERGGKKKSKLIRLKSSSRSRRRKIRKRTRKSHKRHNKRSKRR